MKNIITLDTKSGLLPELSFDEGVLGNVIAIRIFNIGTNAKIELYYGCDFRKMTVIDGSEFIVPSEYCSDNEIIHIRYIDEEVTSSFIHIAGNESLYEDLQLVKKSNYLFCCSGKKKNSLIGINDTTIDDYLDILSKNPVTNEAITSAIVELQNAINEEKEKLALLYSDIETLQSKIQEQDTSTKKAIAGLNNSLSSLGQALSNKIDKVEGKGLSTNDYTTAEKEKLASLSSDSGDYEQGSWTPSIYESSSSSAPVTSVAGQAYYVKIGRLVYVRAYLGFNDAVSCYKITGLPFISDFTSWMNQHVTALLISRADIEEKFKAMFCANNAVRNTGVLDAAGKYRESDTWMLEGLYLSKD